MGLGSQLTALYNRRMRDKGEQARCLLFILNYNGTKITCDLLRSLREICFPHPVWVVDNGSDRDDTSAFVEAYPGVEVRRLAVNCGFAGGVNRAMEMAAEAGYEFAYEINNDTLAEDDFLAPCVEIMERFPDVDIVASRTKTLDRATGAFSIWGFCSGPDDLGRYRDGFLETRHVTGCGMLLRVSSFMKFRGLDERFFCYGEENDYCYRIAKAGRKQGFAEKSLILHQGSLTCDGVWQRYFAARNTILFSRLWDSSWQDSGSILIRRVILPSWKDIRCRCRWLHVAAAGHGLADAVLGRYGKRTAPFRLSRGIPLFFFFSPLVFLYAISVSAKMHPGRPRPQP